MAQVKTQSFQKRLKDVLASGLKAAGIKPTIEVEPVKGTNLHRVLVTAKGFKELRPSERQDLVWRIVAFSFPQDEQLKISMILTLTPDEQKGN